MEIVSLLKRKYALFKVMPWSYFVRLVIKLSGLQHEDSATLFSENAFALQSAEFSADREDGCTC
jgi:hypothetical protein